MKKISVLFINLFLACVLVVSAPVRASGIPVVDIVGNIRGILELVEAVIQSGGQATEIGNQVSQISNQVSQLTNQLTQIENQYKSLKNLGAYNYQDYINILGQLDSVARRTGALAFATANLDGEYDKYRDLAYYEANGDLYAAKTAANQRWATNGSETTKSSAAVLKQQHTSLTNDAQTLADLQAASKGVEGEVQAVQAGNQLASFTGGQLMQVRQLMMNQQQFQLQDRAQETEERAISDAAFKKMTTLTTDTASKKY